MLKLVAEPKSLGWIIDIVLNMHNLYNIYVSEVREPFDFKVLVKIFVATLCPPP